MAKGNEEITGWKVYSRLIRKMSRPGVLPAFVKARRLDNDTVDSLGQRVVVASATWPDEIAIKYEDLAITWREFNERTNRYAHALADRSIGRDDVVAVDVVNRPEMLVATMAVLKLGGIAALINTGIKGDPLAHSLRVVDPKAIIIGEEQVASLETISTDGIAETWLWISDGGGAGCPHEWTDLDEAAASAPTTNPPVTASLKLGHPAIYIYTSGTTGLPKAAITKHLRLRMGGMLVGKAILELTPSDTVYSPLPLYHSTGLLGAWASAVHTGSAIAIGRRFSASTFWDEIRRHEATAFNYVGEVLRYLLNQPPTPGDRDHSVRGIYGAGLRPEIWDEFKERFNIPNIYEVWGASESPNGFLNLLNFDKTIGWNPMGWKTVEWDMVREQPVRGADGFMREIGPGGTGLLIMKIDAHQEFAGYTDAEATEKKILRDVFEPSDAWFDSGDLVHNLGHGHARFVDRTGDTYRWNGENVATTEVEGVAGAWHQVDQAVVYGVEVPGTEGRCGMVLLMLHEGQELDAEGFAKHLRSQLPKFAVPRFVRISSTVAMTGTFRPQKFDLKSDGYDPAKITDPLLILVPDEDAFRPVTPEVVDQVASGDIRL
ncbi:MAG: long-chain-acyl-CoA synthetase [Actinobacteria bacterium]|nr:long-chain-acyl-CoA synthetase [Actinomycetota bacterium]